MYNCICPTSTNLKHMACSLHINGNEAQSEGKPSPSDLPCNTLPTPKAANEPPTTSAKLQVKEEAKKTKNNMWRKLNLLQGNIMSESSSLADRLKNPGPLLNNKRNSFKQDCTKLPANPLLFSVACCIL